MVENIFDCLKLTNIFFNVFKTCTTNHINNKIE